MWHIHLRTIVFYCELGDSSASHSWQTLFSHLWNPCLAKLYVFISELGQQLLVFHVLVILLSSLCYSGRITIYYPVYVQGNWLSQGAGGCSLITWSDSCRTCVTVHFQSPCFLGFLKLFWNVCTGLPRETWCNPLNISDCPFSSLIRGQWHLLWLHVKTKLELVCKDILKVIKCSAYMNYF